MILAALLLSSSLLDFKYEQPPVVQVGLYGFVVYVPRKEPSLVAPALIYGLGCSGDWASTEFAISRNAMELNPALNQPWKRGAIMMGYPMALALWDRHLMKHGHKTAAWTLRGLMILKSVAIVGVNMRAARRDK